MKFKHLGLLLGLALFVPTLSVNAAKISNLSVNGNSDYLNINWDQLSSTDFDNADGYAVQWSDRESNTDITDSVANYIENNNDDIALRRNSFENDTYYYARIYTYKIDGSNRKVLGNGSDRLKFKISFQNEVTSETISVTDPVINNDTGEANDTSNFEFGTLRKYPYDTFSDLFWSRPSEMATSDFDEFLIVLSENSDMTDPILKTGVDRDSTSVRVTGLTPEKNYYAQGHFKKNSDTFGDSPVKQFKTIAAIPRDSSTRQSRNIIKVENRAIRKVSIDGGTVSTTSSTSSTTSSSSNISTTTAVSTSSQSTINNADEATAKIKIADLKRQISSLQSELRKWEAKVGTTSSTTSTRTTSTPKRSSGLSVRERLKLILEAKRK